jgi:DNA-binding phage protein
MAKARPFDAADYLDSPEMIAAYLSEASKSDEPAAIAMALAAVGRARRDNEAPKE